MNENYQIRYTIGEGAFGTAYLARDVRSERDVTIKKYRRADSHLSKCIGKVQDLEQSEDIPGLVNIFDFCSEGEDCYLVMEYLSGGTLRSFVSGFHHRQIPEKTLLPLLAPVMEALLCLHSAGIVHCDISPDNLMLDGEGRCRLIDLDSANLQGDADRERILKEAYAAPEQYTNPDWIGPWTDVYSMCALLYELLTGHKVPSASERIREDTLLPPSSHVKISPSVEQALMRGLEPDIQKRYFSTEALMRALGLDPGNAAVHNGEVRHRWGMLWVSVSAEGKYSENKKQSRLRFFLPKLAAALAVAATVSLAFFGGWQYYIRHNQEQVFKRKIAQAREYARKHPDRYFFPPESEEYAKHVQYLEEHGERMGPSFSADYTLTEEDLMTWKFPNNYNKKLYPDLTTARDIVFYYMGISEENITFRDDDYVNTLAVTVDLDDPGYLYNACYKSSNYSCRFFENGEKTDYICFDYDPINQRMISLRLNSEEPDRCKLFLAKVLPVICPETYLTEKEIDEILNAPAQNEQNHSTDIMLCEKAFLEISYPFDSFDRYMITIAAD